MATISRSELIALDAITQRNYERVTEKMLDAQFECSALKLELWAVRRELAKMVERYGEL